MNESTGRDLGAGRKPGRTVGRPATIYSVAEEAGVSIATVSRVLRGTATASPAAVKSVMAAARRLNYVPQNSARSLATRRYRTHGVVIGSMAGPYWSELLMGCEEASAAHGQSMLVSMLDPTRAAERDLLDLRGRVDGVVISHPTLATELITDLAQEMPVAVVGRAGVPGCDVVLSENLANATELTSHLLRHGRRRLVFVGDPEASGDVSERYDGFVAAHTEAGQSVSSAPLAVPYTEEAGRAAVQDLLESHPDADGVVCANDELALSIAVGLRDAGVAVGDAVAVTGWDDVLAARYISPGLTTVRQPVREMGALAARLLHGRIVSPDSSPQTHVLPTEVVLRQSCGCR